MHPFFQSNPFFVLVRSLRVNGKGTWNGSGNDGGTTVFLNTFPTVVVLQPRITLPNGVFVCNISVANQNVGRTDHGMFFWFHSNVLIRVNVG